MLMGQRLYDPATGRFLQTDPVEGGSANNYDYVSADPVQGRDYDGTCGFWGNPWKKCGKHHHGGRGFLGGIFSKSARFVAKHRSTIATWGAIGGCFVQPELCGAFQAGAWAVRSQQRGYSHYRENARDGMWTWTTIWMGGLTEAGGAGVFAKAATTGVLSTARFVGCHFHGGQRGFC